MIIAATIYGKVGGSSSGAPICTTDTGYVAPTLYTDQETGDWELVFLGNWSGKLDRNVEVEVFAVGGGQTGSREVDGAAGSWAQGGNGGSGGQVVTTTKQLTKETPYTVTIGDAGQSTSAFGDVTATSGGSNNGGAGAYTNGGGADAGNGGPGALAFGRSGPADRTLYEQNLITGGTTIYFGAGGGGGSATDGLSRKKLAGAGGTTGGGKGGSDSNNEPRDGQPGQAHTGAGGGGSRCVYVTDYPMASNPGAGGSGIVIIRNVRASE